MSSPHLSLKSLRARAAFLQEADQVLRSCLPAEAADCVHVGDCSGQRLTLIANTAAWATRLRYQTASISGVFSREMGFPVSRVDIRVRCAQLPTIPPQYERRLTLATRRNLADTANAISDKRLADALLRLSRAGRDD